MTDDSEQVDRSGRGLPTTSATQGFSLSSQDFSPERQFTQAFLFHGLGCGGGNLSPGLDWDSPPAGTGSFALMVHDAHAETGGAGVWHWVVVDLPASSRSIPQGAGTADGFLLPRGSRQIRNDYAGFTDGSPGWGGPCPPEGHGTHDYVFTLYALPVERLDLPSTATASHFGFVINRMKLGEAKLIGRYGR